MQKALMVHPMIIPSFTLVSGLSPNSDSLGLLVVRELFGPFFSLLGEKNNNIVKHLLKPTSKFQSQLLTLIILHCDQ